jgi:hypothetical protein
MSGSVLIVDDERSFCLLAERLLARRAVPASDLRALLENPERRTRG